MRIPSSLGVALAAGSLLAASLTLPATAQDGASDAEPTPDPNTVVTFLAELPHKKRALEREAQAISDPSSDSFREYLTVRQAAREFGATKAQVDKVIDASLALGLTAEIDPTRLVARISGTVSAWEQAMGTSITYSASSPGDPYNSYEFPGPSADFPSPDNPQLWSELSAFIGATYLGAPAPLDAAVNRFVAYYGEYVPADDIPAASTSQVRQARSVYAPGSTSQTPPTNPAAGLMDNCIDEPGVPIASSFRTGEPFPAETFVGHRQVFGAYGLSELQDQAGAAASNRVTIISLGGGFSEQDLADAAECFGFTKPEVNITLGTGVPSPFVNVDVETTLDVQTVASTLKNARSINLVQSQNTNAGVGHVDSYTRALTARPTPHAITLSYGGCEPLLANNGLNPTVNSLFQFAAVVGTTIAIASGDSGSSICQTFFENRLSTLLASIENANELAQEQRAQGNTGEAEEIEGSIQEALTVVAGLQALIAGGRPSVAFPASSPWATAVGGTQILMNADGTRSGEVIWNDQPYSRGAIENLVGTGGPSAVYNAPSYQQPLTRNNARVVPDIAAMAGPSPSLPLVYRGVIFPIGGTSQSSPMMAAALGLLSANEIEQGRERIGFANPWLYEMVKRQPETVYDVTIGDTQFAIPFAEDSFTIPACCQAELGFDAASGLGVLDFSEARKHTVLR